VARRFLVHKSKLSGSTTICEKSRTHLGLMFSFR
jgi:hypothetical protein